MNGSIVNSSISSNIYAPSLLIGIFLVLFIPYSYHAFLKNRKQEYGILMTLGMREKEVFFNMLLENCIIAGLSLICGLILGTLISFIFYFIIQVVIGVTGLQWYFNAHSYVLTSFFYGGILLLTLVTSILSITKMQLIDLLKDRFRGEKRGKALPGIFVMGVVFVIVSVLIMVTGYGYGATTLWFLSLTFMFTGIYIILTNVVNVEQYFTKIFPNYMQRHILEISFLKQHHRSHSRISIITSWLIGFAIFFAGLSTVMYPSLIDNASNYSPYDLVYSQIFGMNQVEDIEIESLLNQNGVSVKTVKQVEFLRDRTYNLLPALAVNEAFDCNYQLKQGEFRMVFQYDLNDGYEHEMTLPETVRFDCGYETIVLQSSGSDVRILFNRNPTFADKTMVLSDMDYSKIALEREDCWAGVMKLYSFDDWKNSSDGIIAVQEYLYNANQVDRSKQIYYKASSRIETYKTAKQSAEFLIFLMFFIVILFYVASNVMIHFKIKAETEEEQRMLSSLYRIGVTYEEMLKIIRHKNIFYFMPQVIIGLFLGGFYNYFVNEFYGFGWKAAGYSLLIGMVVVVLQFAIVKRYSKRELMRFSI